MYTVMFMEVFSIRIPKEIKQKMKETEINWSEEIRKFIETRIKEYQKKKALEEIKKLHEKLPSTEEKVAAKYVREDRDSH